MVSVKFSFEKLQLIYKVGRLGFSAGLFVLLLSVYSISSKFLDPYSYLVLGIYSFISFLILLFSEKSYLYEFLLDELFLFLLAVKGVFSYTIFSLFLFFPIFFSSLFLNRWQGISVLILSYSLHIFYFLIERGEFNLLQSFLNFLALTLIFLISQKIRENMEEQKRNFEELEKLKKESEFYKRLYEISANLAHELKNPLASIKGALQLIKPERENEKLMKILFTEVDRLDRTIRDFLNLSRPMPQFRKRINAKQVVETVCNNLVSEKSCKVEGEDVWIFTDPQSFNSVVENLINNALYWARSQVIVKVKKDRNLLELRVEDDGPGVLEEDKEKIFEPFFSRRSGGSGLGLSIVKKFVVENGGFILVERSSLGGAAFILKIPVGEFDESSDS
ncbi:Signal transduction histidine kinase [Balnearium lithotrophicum]|uniref:histidine kinase n=1 Tax=Balnearium lithotrophicum TaxID=223788 RepID=A0A521DAP8_9BACT|nr:HAMP domain-containing sensor histidine kinase [Balnearium lithotrophicum]SMO68715.1 Signal transduction histidine kinase [Balnearium lithotrophicum]